MNAFENMQAEQPGLKSSPNRMSANEHFSEHLAAVSNGKQEMDDGHASRAAQAETRRRTDAPLP
jgi:hypothetical protein